MVEDLKEGTVTLCLGAKTVLSVQRRSFPLGQHLFLLYPAVQEFQWESRCAQEVLETDDM